MTGQLISSSLANQILEKLETRHSEIESFIRALVEAESPSGDEAGSRAVVELLANQARDLECVEDVERVVITGFGQHLVIKAFQQQSNPSQILLVGHTDTVHSRGSLAERPWRRDGDRAYGPGVFDMKANCALVIEVFRTIIPPGKLSTRFFV